MQRLWIKNPLAVLAPSDADAGYASAGIVIENDRILECLAAGETPSVPVDDIFDASEHVLLPGLINTHHHFYQTLTRACPPALKVQPLSNSSTMASSVAVVRASGVNRAQMGYRVFNQGNRRLFSAGGQARVRV